MCTAFQAENGDQQRQIQNLCQSFHYISWDFCKCTENTPTWHLGYQNTDMWKKWLKNNLLFVYQLFKHNSYLVKCASENAPAFKLAWNNKSEDWYQGYHPMKVWSIKYL